MYRKKTPINEIWVILSTGVCIVHAPREKSTDKANMSLLFSGVFSAIQIVAKNDLQCFGLNSCNLIVQSMGKNFIVAKSPASANNKKVRKILKGLGEIFQEKYGDLSAWNGEMDIFDEFYDSLDRYL